MATLSGIASAVYGNDEEQKFTLSVVTSTQRHDAQLISTQTHPVDIHSPASLRERFDCLFSAVARAVRERRDQEVASPVPVITGCPVHFPMAATYAHLRVAYAHLFAPPGAGRAQKKRRAQLAAKRATDVSPSHEEDDARTAMVQFGDMLGRYLARAGVPAGSIDFHPRGFAVEELQPGAMERIRQEGTESTEEEVRWLALKERADGGDVAALEQLRFITRIQATLYARSLLRVRRGIADSRFFGFGPRVEPLTTRPRYNFIRWFDLRTVFGEELIRVLRLDHHVAPIAPGDAAMPQFTDPLATILADQHDVLTGNKQKTAVIMLREQRPA